MTLKDQVLKRDNYRCRLWCILTEEEKDLIRQYLYPPLSYTDTAHIVSKAKSKKLQEDIDNIITLTRIFHTRLDQFKNPLTGKFITKKERENWFIRIVGEEHYQKLLEKSKEKRERL